MTQRGGSPALALHPQQRAFIERRGALSRQIGMPKSTFRVMGLLGVCQPAEQSAQVIQATLGLSTGSVSIALTTLTKLQMVERLRLPNERPYYYRLNPDGFKRALELRLHITTQAKYDVDTMAQLDPVNERLEKWRDFYALEQTSIHDVLAKMQ